MVLDCFLDALIDSLKILPILLLVYILISYFFHRDDEKYTNYLKNAKKASVVIGATLGTFPQCGFSAVMADLYSKKNITIGTLVAVFIATSDEAIPIMFSKPDFIVPMIVLVAIKFVGAIIIGYLVDFIFGKILKKNMQVVKTIHLQEHVNHEQENHIHCEHHVNGEEECDKHNNHCCADNIFVDAFKHTFSIFCFLLIATFIINIFVELVGADKLSSLFGTNSYLQILMAGIVGLIPNCVASVFLVEFYMAGSLTFGALVAGLSVGAGVGYLVLFRKNKKLTSSLLVLGITFISGLILGVLVNLIGIF